MLMVCEDFYIPVLWRKDLSISGRKTRRTLGLVSEEEGHKNFRAFSERKRCGIVVVETFSILVKYSNSLILERLISSVILI
jgi:hypothetical protein